MNQFPPSPPGGLGSGMGFPFSGGFPGGAGPGLAQPSQSGIAGLLSKLLGGGGASSQSLPLPPGSFQGMQAGGLPGAQQAGGMLSSLLQGNAQGGMDMMGMVQNVQKVMQAADTIKPMVQQYGPMVKQLPEMIALFKEYKNSSSSDESEGDEEQSVEGTEEKKLKKNTQKSSGPKPIAKKKTKNETSINHTGRSKPKLYV